MKECEAGAAFRIQVDVFLITSHGSHPITWTEVMVKAAVAVIDRPHTDRIWNLSFHLYSRVSLFLLTALS